MSKLVVGNWKLNPSTAVEAVELARATDFPNAVICPPDIFLMQVGKVLEKASLGAQDLFWENAADITGEASTEQLLKVGVSYVIVGHSSRREEVGETDELVNLKLKAAVAAKLKAILCIGENLELHKQGEEAARQFVAGQLDKALKGIKEGEEYLLVAYEPIWSISTSGTGLTDTPQEAAQMIRYIKDALTERGFGKTPVLYGGSVNGETAGAFLKQDAIEGVLVGGASLKADEFKKVVSQA